MLWRAAFVPEKLDNSVPENHAIVLHYNTNIIGKKI